MVFDSRDHEVASEEHSLDGSYPASDVLWSVAGEAETDFLIDVLAGARAHIAALLEGPQIPERIRPVPVDVEYVIGLHGAPVVTPLGKEEPVLALLAGALLGQELHDLAKPWPELLPHADRSTVGQFRAGVVAFDHATAAVALDRDPRRVEVVVPRLKPREGYRILRGKAGGPNAFLPLAGVGTR